jgi:hypothetical protein
MSIILQGSTSGSVTLQEPAVAGTTVLDLPATSGTILTSASSISASKLPAGTVIQTQYYQSATVGSGTSTSTSYVDDGVSIAITPLLSTSKLYVVCSTGCSVSGGYANFRILENVSSTTVQEYPWGNFSGSPQQLDGFTMTGWYVPGNTTTRTFKLQGLATSGGTRYLNYSVRPNITVFEVAA